MSSSPKKGRRACDQNYRRNDRRAAARERRKKDIAVYQRVLDDASAPEGEAKEARTKRDIAVYEVERLTAKIVALVYFV